MMDKYLDQNVPNNILVPSRAIIKGLAYHTQKKGHSKRGGFHFFHKLVGSLMFLGLGTSVHPLHSQENGKPCAEEYAAEVDLLRRELLNTTRELYEYKAHLFRASHPKDQAKITELSQQLGEQQAANDQLVTTLQEFEKELLSAKKRASTLETATEALNAMIQTQRGITSVQDAEHQSEVIELQGMLETAKQDLQKQIEANKAFQHRLLIDMSTAIEEQKHAAKCALESIKSDCNNQLCELSKQLEQEQILSEARACELHTARNYGFLQERRVEEIEKLLEETLLMADNLKLELEVVNEDLDLQMKAFKAFQHRLLTDMATTIYEQVQVADIAIYTLQNEFNSQVFELSSQVQREHLFTEAMAHDLQIARDYAVLQERRSDAHEENLRIARDYAVMQERRSDELEESLQIARDYAILHEQRSGELEENLQIARDYAILQENRSKELEDHHAAAVAMGHTLAGQLEEAQQQANDQERLADTIRQLEEAQSSLIDELFLAKDQLESQAASIEFLQKELADMASSHETQHEKFKELDMDLQDALQETAMLKFSLADTQALADNKQQVLNETQSALSEAQTKHLALAEQLALSLNALTMSVDQQNHLLDKHSEYQLLASRLIEKEAAIAATLVYYQTFIDKYQSQADDLMTKQEEQKVEVISLQMYLEDLASKHTNTSNRNIDLENNLQALALQLEEKNRELLAALEQIHNLQYSLDSEKSSLQTKNDEQQAYLETHLQTLASQIEEKNQELLAVLEEAERLKSSHDLEKNSLLSELKEQKDNHETDLHILASQIEEKNQELLAVLEEAERLKSSHDLKKNSLLSKLAEQKDNHETYLYILASEIEEKNQDLLTALELTEHLKSSHDLERNNLLSTLEEQKANHETYLSSLSSQMEEKNQELFAALEQIDRLQASHALEKSDLSSKLEQQLVEVLSLQNHLNALHLNFTDATNNHDDLEKNLQTISLLVQEKDQDLSMALEQIKNLQAFHDIEKSHLLSKLEEQRAQANSLQNNLEALSQKHTDLDQNNSDLQQEIQNLVYRLEEKDRQLLVTLEQVESLNESIGQKFALVQDINDLKAHLEDDKSVIASLLNHVDHLNNANQQERLKEKEWQNTIKALTDLAENQDQALTNANLTLQTAQTLYKQLQYENTHLKELLDRAETAEHQAKDREKRASAASAVSLLLRSKPSEDKGNDVAPFLNLEKN